MEAQAFLARVSAALGGASAPWTPPDTRAAPSAPRRRVELLHLHAEFAAHLAKVGGTAELVPASQAAARAMELLGDGPRVHVGLELLPACVRAVVARGAAIGPDSDPLGWRAACAEAEWGVTDAVQWVAETGSTLLCATARRPRAASLLPRRHMVVTPLSRLVADLDEALTHLADAPSQWLLVTGPSRTSDIENDLTIGVHGPGVMHVLVVDEDEA
jgi:L-lactate utilization protein LutC